MTHLRAFKGCSNTEIETVHAHFRPIINKLSSKLGQFAEEQAQGFSAMGLRDRSHGVC